MHSPSDSMGGAASIDDVAAAVSRASDAELGAALGPLAPADRRRLADVMAAAPHAKKFVDVKGRKMAYVDAGAGPAIVFVHGSPTSSYMWRNVLGALGGARVVAVDLVGFGDSDKVAGAGDDRYSLAAQGASFDAFLEALAFDAPITLVGHSWGATLAADWARRNEDRVTGVAFMECAFAPFTAATAPPHIPPFVEAVRSARGDAMVLDANVVIERALPAGVVRALPDAVLAHYRAPFAEPGEARRPMLALARSIPLDGEPADVARNMVDGAAWLAATHTPKLAIFGDPGSSTTPAERDAIRAWPNLTEATVPGKHLLTEDAPEEIGAALARWWTALYRDDASPAPA